MNYHQWHHHHHNQSYSTQGNTTLCPTCSISHFPPHAPPPPPPTDPYIDPARNPSMTHMANFGNCGSKNVKRYDPGLRDGYDYLSDRSSKRLRVGGIDESRFRLVRDCGSEVIHNFSKYRDVGSYGKHESFDFDGNVDAREQAGVSSVGYNSYMNEMGYQSGYGSYGGVKRSVFDGQGGLGNVGHEFRDRYGDVVNPVDCVGSRQGWVVGYQKDGSYQGHQSTSYGSSYGSNESSYGNSLEQPRNLNNAPMPYEQRNNVTLSSHYSGSQAPFVNTMQQHGHTRYDYHSASLSQFSDGRYPLDAPARPVEGYQGSFVNQHASIQPDYGPPHGDNHGGYGNLYSENKCHFQVSQGVDVRPPLPPLPASPPPPPPPPLPMEPPPVVSSSLFTVVASSSSAVQSSYARTPEFHMSAQPHLPSAQVLDSCRGMMQRDSQPPLTPPGHFVRESSGLPSKNSFKDKPKVFDASQLFKPPHRATRPDHFVIILRGLPG